MSKSYSKVKKFGFCKGNNTEYYDEKRRNLRAKEKQVMRDTIAHNDISEFDDVYTPLNLPFKDSWDEPTDGTFLMDAKMIDRDEYINGGGYRGVYTTKDGKIKK